MVAHLHSPDEEYTPHCFIATLPPETLGEILVRCVDPLHSFGALKSTPSKKYPSHNFPIYLAQISSWWRRVALHTPALWSAVHLMLTDGTAERNGAVLASVDGWLAHGIKGQLTLDMSTQFRPTQDLSAEAAAIGKLLSLYASDLKRFSLLDIPEVILRDALEALSHHSFTSLEAINIYPSDARIWSSHFDILRDLHRLREVHLDTKEYVRHDVSLLCLPWGQLKSLSITTPVFSMPCLHMLAKCPALKSLKLRIIAGGGSLPRSPILLEHLTSLSVELHTSDESIDPFLAALRLPIIMHLSLLLGRFSLPWNPLISHFWSRHAGQLRRATLAFPAFDDLTTLCRTMPALEALTLFIPLRLHVLDALREEHLLPRLTRLTAPIEYDRSVPLPTSIRRILVFLEQRSGSTLDPSPLALARLQEVKFRDETPYGGNPWIFFEPGDSFGSAMEEELGIRALKAVGVDIQWEVDCRDIFLPRIKPARNVVLRRRLADSTN
ncbi:hypothetical protein R3P38DRAFT_2985298 [Favolaschia claudopus]|uniref:F-box domain-containing protein n=1 Tax=Favolaschia claudopus TaxID=2862362 RepID=A0AAW0AXR1_9AGAR